MTSKPRERRADIDGLRAIAVLAIVVYHLDGLPGGFVGVDIFFVISGYLITGIIASKLDSRSFSFSEFLLRRFRRLFPAMFATVCLTFFAAYYLLPPPELRALAGASIASTFSVSNIYFWRGSGYFDTDAMTKPLLHTWSLGVEEQFYLVWPLLLIFAWRVLRGRVAVAMVAVGALSLAGSVWLVSTASATAFFWMPLRAYEFAIGGLVTVFAVSYRTKAKNSVVNAAFVIGLLGIVIPLALYSESTTFPGWSALAPCLGTALVIWSQPTGPLRLLLENKLAVWIGKISYSVYLVHWPLIVLFAYYNVTPLSAWDRSLLFAATIVLGFVVYKLVESPFRNGVIGATVPWRFAGVTVVIAAVFPGIAVFHSAWAGSGWPWRLPDELRNSIDVVYEQRAEYWNSALNFAPYSGAGKRVYVIGNSFAVDIYTALEDVNGVDPRIDGSTGYECYALRVPITGATADCAGNFSRLSATDHARKADIIVINELWNLAADRETFLRLMQGTVDRVRSINPRAELVIVGPKVTFEGKPAYQRVLDFGRLQNVDKYLAEFYEYPFDEYARLDKDLRDFSAENGVRYISILDLLCDDGVCDVLTPWNTIMYWDSSHWSWEGAHYFAQRLSESGVASDVFGVP